MQQQIEAYFGGHLIHLNISICPDISEHELYVVTIEVAYRDFKPEKEVSRELYEMFDKLHILSIERLYSDEVMEQALKEMEEEFGTIEDVYSDDFLFEQSAWLHNKELQ